MQGEIQLTDKAYQQIRQFFFLHSGIDLPEAKRHLVTGRLRTRLLQLNLTCYEDYFALIKQADQHAERQYVVDVLTTNETYFFREPQHFKLLTEQILPSLKGRRPRIWCGAASSGEEPYSLAMLLSDKLGLNGWDLLASDLSSRILLRAERGLYPMQRIELLPERYLKDFCQRGTGEYEGQFLIRRELRERVEFVRHNLLEHASHLGRFDLIFLRNVLIYFGQQSKQLVLDQITQQLKPGGWLVIGHAESLYGVNTPLKTIRPSVFRLPGGGA